MLRGLGLNQYGFLKADTDAKVEVFTINISPPSNGNPAKKYKDAEISVSLRMENPLKQHLDHHVTLWDTRESILVRQMGVSLRDQNKCV